MHRHRTPLLTLILAFLCVFPALGQEEPEGESVFVDTVDVNIVSLDVYATDRQGNPVTDLTKDDFRVEEDGREVKISSFVRVDEWEESRIERTAIPKEELEVEESSASTPAGVDPRRLFMVVYVDNLNISPFSRNRVFSRLRQFLRKTLREGDRVMLVTYNRSLKTRVEFTSDAVTINSELFEMEDESGQAIHRESERIRTLRSIEESQSYTQALFWARGSAEPLYHDVQMTVQGLRELVGMVAGLPGRKIVVHVSDGIPMVAGEDLFYALNEKFQTPAAFTESRDFDSTRSFQELVAYANSSRVTFYTIDAAGLRAPGGSMVQSAHSGISNFVDSQNIQNLQSSIVRIANDTGGKAIINANDVGPALEKVRRDLRSYYSLGYYVTHSGDGRYHRVEVKVNRKGVRVRHRTGYRDITLVEKMEQSLMATLRFDEEFNPLGIRARFGDPTARSEGNFIVPVLVAIPLGKITLIPRRETFEASVRLYVAAMDDDGGTSPVQEVTIPIRVAKAEIEVARDKVWPYQMPLLMSPGKHKIAIGARDNYAGVESFISRRIGVGPQ